MMELAGCEVKRRGQPGYNQTSTQALLYMRSKANYFHTWTHLVPKAEDGPNLPADLVEDEDDEGLVPVLAIGCSAPSAFCRRPSEAQFKWFKQVLGKEPRWFLIDQEQYDCVQPEVWRVTLCCPSVSDILASFERRTTQVFSGLWSDSSCRPGDRELGARSNRGGLRQYHPHGTLRVVQSNGAHVIRC